MCGFAGFLALPQARESGLGTLNRMASTLVRRGPDEQGLWLSEDGATGLAHRRLAVVGLGPDGCQPMTSASGRWVVAYNGEIYNFPILRSELSASGIGFKGTSDTEVILAAIEAWGLERSLKRFVGMFAFALWDSIDRVLYLARDRFGEKPLYYGWQGDAFLFGSDLAALRVHPQWADGIDRAALSLYVRYNYVPSPRSIHPGIKKLAPGTWLALSPQGSRWIERHGCYWSALSVAAEVAANPFAGSEADAEDLLHGLLRQAVSGQLMAEVPLGAFLSGGIDSTAVVALMQTAAQEPVRTFTIGFSDSGYDESESAKRIANYLGTAHRTCILDARDALAIIPRMPDFYSEPFADASQIATALVSRVAREEVTVALSGDGGDEVFGGYNRYVWGESLFRRTRCFPRWSRSLLRDALLAASPSAWDKLAGMLPGIAAVRQPGEKLHKFAAALDAGSPQAFHDCLTTFWRSGNPVLGAPAEVSGGYPSAELWRSNRGLTESMMLADTLNYLPDDILVKVDRAAMGFSLETRAPFLDHRLFAFVWSLPLHFRVRRHGGKYLLRKLLDRYVPREMVERPKSGFALPVHEWLRGPLRDWCEGLLNESRLRQEGFFDPVVVRKAWDEHLSGRKNRQYDLWSILMFQAWQESLRQGFVLPAAAEAIRVHGEARHHRGIE
jgi:asparagine synthase (glutamine-hydrolysing)